MTGDSRNGGRPTGKRPPPPTSSCASSLSSSIDWIDSSKCKLYSLARQPNSNKQKQHNNRSTSENSITSDEDDFRQILASNNNNNSNGIFNTTTNKHPAENQKRSHLLSNPFNKKLNYRPRRSDDSETPEENRNKTTLRTRLVDGLCVALWRTCCLMSLIILLSVLIYIWPIGSNYQLRPKVAPARPRPHFTGPLSVNSHLDELAERLFEEQFHAPESMAWTSDRRAFYTGVEGGFILLVEPYAERWSVAAKLNAPLSVEDKSSGVKFVGLLNTKQVSFDDDDDDDDQQTDSTRNQSSTVDLFAPFCKEDVRLYGKRAEFEPSLVRLSRCSRPLGIRLSPDETHLYVMDPLSGFYRVDLVAEAAPPPLAARRAAGARPLGGQNHVSKLIDFTKFKQNRQEDPMKSESRIIFGDDIAVDWGAGTTGTGASSSSSSSSSSAGDVIYMTDCSQRWTLRYLLWLMFENDDSGRVLTFDTNEKIIRPLGQVTPVKIRRQLNFISTGPQQQQGQSSSSNNNSNKTTMATFEDRRALSFPNGLELTANGSSLLISDLNNRRILMHHLRGPLKGTTSHLMWVPGYPDNIRRGLDDWDGSATYWFACGCAVSDGNFELAEFFNELPIMKVLLLKSLHLLGSLLDAMGQLLDSTGLQDWGLLIDAAWLKRDPYCRHGLVGQFNEQGQVLRSLHGPQFSSHFKLISEAHQVALPDDDRVAQVANSSAGGQVSALYLGSVYYSYLGRLELSARPAKSS